MYERLVLFGVSVIGSAVSNYGLQLEKAWRKLYINGTTIIFYLLL